MRKTPPMILFNRWEINYKIAGTRSYREGLLIFHKIHSSDSQTRVGVENVKHQMRLHSGANIDEHSHCLKIKN